MDRNNNWASVRNRTPPLHIDVLSRNMEYWTTRKIKAGRLKGHETNFAKTGDVKLKVDDARFDALYGTKSLREADVLTSPKPKMPAPSSVADSILQPAFGR